MTAAYTAGYEVGKNKGYEKGFAEGVDWATPRIWNEAIEAAASATGHGFVLGKPPNAEMIAAAIRKLKKP